MAANHLAANDPSRQSDLLLWVAGGVVVTVGVAWLLISQPWSSGPDRPVAAAVRPAAAAAPNENIVLAVAEMPAANAPPPGEMLDDPLKMARLAYDAGMLVEPEEYSAWTLYAKVLDREPANMEAREGLTKVAEELLRRGETALEQGRFADVRSTTARILAVLPAHAGALALAERVLPELATAPPVIPASFEISLPSQQPAPAVTLVPSTTPVVAAETPRAQQQQQQQASADPVDQAYAQFAEAMSSSRLLTPADESAKHFVAVLAAVGPKHELTTTASARLSAEFLARAAESLEAADTDGAATWIDEAQLVGVDVVGVNAARAKLTTQLIALESAKPLPTSALKVKNYVPPVFPERALDRGIEGWVDLQFTVTTDGSIRDVEITDASHENYFRNEALAAVQQWRFEPRVFMGRAIEQRSYTRIRFVQ